MKFDAIFHAPASRWDTSMDDRFGRALAGSFGRGSLEVTNDGMIVFARRHRYAGNLAGGAIFGVAFLVLGLLVMRKSSDYQHVWVWGFFGGLFGAFLTSLVFRFTKRHALLVPWTNIDRLKWIGGRGRIFCRTGGDVELSVPPQAWQALQHASYSRGVRCE